MFRYAKTSGPKVMKGLVLAFDVWVSDPKSKFLANFAKFQIFILLVEYENTSATKRYFILLLLVIKYTFCKRMVMWKECI